VGKHEYSGSGASYCAEKELSEIDYLAKPDLHQQSTGVKQLISSLPPLEDQVS
jgi:hypothetical protein